MSVLSLWNISSTLAHAGFMKYLHACIFAGSSKNELEHMMNHLKHGSARGKKSAYNALHLIYLICIT